MASLTPAAVRNENLHINRGKGVEGSKLGVIQNENLHILKGKVVEGFKAEIPKPAKAGRQERKALADLSRTGKPVLSAANKATAPKDKSTAALTESDKKLQKRYNLSDEAIRECLEWAEEGIEYMPHPTNDVQIFTFFDHLVEDGGAYLPEWMESPVKEVPSDTQDTSPWRPLEFEPEVLPFYRWSSSRSRSSRRSRSSPKTPDYEEFDDLFCYSPRFELKLKEEYEDDVISE